MTHVGFCDVEVVERRPFGLDDAELYPLFTADLIELARTILTERQQAHLAVAVTVTAHKAV